MSLNLDIDLLFPDFLTTGSQMAKDCTCWADKDSMRAHQGGLFETQALSEEFSGLKRYFLTCGYYSIVLHIYIFVGVRIYKSGETRTEGSRRRRGLCRERDW